MAFAGFAILGVFIAVIVGIIGVMCIVAVIIGIFTMGGESWAEKRERRKALKQVIWTEDGRNGDYSESPIGFVKVQNTGEEAVPSSGQDKLSKLENIFASGPAEKK